MFQNHSTAFAEFQAAIPAAPLSISGSQTTLSGETLVETPHGWVAARTLQTGDALATLDGGFVPITAITTPRVTSAMVHIPGGALSNCSDVMLPGHVHVGLDLPAHLSDAPLVTAPLNALCGWNGIRPTLSGTATLATLHFDSEELVFAQTGLLVHAAPRSNPFFEQLSHGETCAKIARLQAQMAQPHCVAA